MLNKMKKINLLFTLIILLATCQLSSCGKGGNSPVDQIVVLLEEATKKTEQINSMMELTNVRNIVSPDDVWNIIRENSDYKLSKGDKDKLKKSFNRLVNTAYDKSAEFVPDGNMKKAVKSQLDLMMEAIDQNIDNAETLGDIRSFN